MNDRLPLRCILLHTISMDTSGWPPMPRQQEQRTQYVAQYMASGSKQEALHVSGLSGSHTHERITQHLLECGTLAERQHQRAPTKYTGETLKACLEALIANADQVYTTPTFVKMLEEQHILEPPTDGHNFMQHLKEYAAQEGLTLVTGDTSTIFRITEEAAEHRLAWCKKMLQLLHDGKALSDFIFVDEMTVEESPHPKGRQQYMALGVVLLVNVCCWAWLCVHMLLADSPPQCKSSKGIGWQ